MAWLLAARPHTLGVTLSGVLAACTLAWHQKGGLDWPVAIVTFLAAILIQIATNLFNDAGDYESGIDRGERLGPDRAVAKGWLGTRQVKQAGLGCLALAFVLGVYLVVVGGWPIVLLGLVALFSAGPIPWARHRFRTGRWARSLSGCFSDWRRSWAPTICRPAP